MIVTTSGEKNNEGVKGHIPLVSAQCVSEIDIDGITFEGQSNDVNIPSIKGLTAYS